MNKGSGAARKRKGINVIIVEDDEAFLHNLSYAMEEEGIAIIRVCRGIEDALECFDSLTTHPDVAVISLELLKQAASVHLEYIRDLRLKLTETKLIVVADRCTEDGKLSMSREGVHGIILRREPISKIIKCIRVVNAGEIWMDAQIVSNVFKEYTSFYHGSGENINPPTPFHFERLESLTSREKEILELLSMSLTNEEIARGLFISIDTVKTHVRNIFEKLQVKNRVEAALVFVGSSRMGNTT